MLWEYLWVHSQIVKMKRQMRLSLKKVQPLWVQIGTWMAYALYESLMDKTISVDCVCSADVTQRITTILDEKIDYLKYSRTASLWLQYMNMVDTLQQYKRTERTGNWALHLDAISKMLSYLATSGHNHYSKSAWVYLQRISQLEKQTSRHLSTIPRKSPRGEKK